MKTPVNTLGLTTDDTILVVGGLLATATNLVRDPEQGAAFGGDPETFLALADKIATAFVNAAMAAAEEHPSRKVELYRDCYDLASTMSSGIQAYESWAGPCKFTPAEFTHGVAVTDALAELEGETLREYARRQFDKDLN